MAEDKKFITLINILLAANILTAMVGLYIAVFPEGFLLRIYNLRLAEHFFQDGTANHSTELKNWLFGVLGGTILGFHILMIFIIVFPLKRMERWAYYALWIAMLAWFIVDTSSSLYHAAYFNVVIINLFALVVNVIPLLFLKPYFMATEDS